MTTAKRRSRPPRRGPRRSAPDALTAAAKPQPSKGRGRAIGAALTIVGALVAVGGAYLAWLYLGYPSSVGPSQGHAVEIVIAESDTNDTIAQKLEEAGLIKSAHRFAWYMGLGSGAENVARGPHYLTDDAPPREILAHLERRSGATKTKVTFPEGWTRFDIAKRLQEKQVCSLRAFLNATTDASLLKDLRIDAESAEGYLFPATYELAKDSDPLDVVKRMKAEFDRRWASIEQRRGSELLDLGASAKFGIREIVTLASMVEKEAVVDEERPVIAGVFLNRIRDPEFKPKLLQCDPTAGYGCLAMPERIPACSSYTGKITPAINNDPANPYSTYTHTGLPPGPIANPGAKSLEAAVAPSRSRYFYFVAKGEGRHSFSETYDAHNSAIRDGGAKQRGTPQ